MGRNMGAFKVDKAIAIFLLLKLFLDFVVDFTALVLKNNNTFYFSCITIIIIFYLKTYPSHSISSLPVKRDTNSFVGNIMDSGKIKYFLL